MTPPCPNNFPVNSAQLFFSHLAPPVMNRRPGGNPRFGGRGPQSFSQQPFQGGGGGVNPWQGGSNQNQGGILSQLTSNPQLALALTSLLQPQQQQPPSLLSLNTSPAFSNNRDYGGRYNSGGINRGRDVRRHEPYNKVWYFINFPVVLISFFEYIILFLLVVKLVNLFHLEFVYESATFCALFKYKCKVRVILPLSKYTL